MLAYFPTPYPDELLFSVVSRLAETMGYPNNSDLSRAVYGQYRTKVAVGLPSRLDDLLANLPPGHPLTLARLLADHTLFPLYQPFLPTARVEQLKTAMKNTQGRNVYNCLGMFNWTVSRLQHLRFCAECVLEDRQRYGQGYWHRSHHVPGVKVCHSHGTRLQNSPLGIYHREPQQRYISLDQALDQVEPAPHHFSPATYQILRQIAADAHWLLTHNNQHITLTSFRRRFHLILVDQGLVSPQTGKIRGAALLTRFRNRYSSELLQWLGCPLNHDNGSAWPRQVVKTQGLKHPLQYLLVMQALGYSVEEFFALPAAALSFEAGPWPCLNPACEQYRRLVIQACHIESYAPDGRPYVTFTCRCGFTYGRYGPDYDPEDRFRVDKIVQRGPVWTAQFHKLQADPTITQEELARRLNLNSKTLQHWLRGQPPPARAQNDLSSPRSSLFDLLDRQRCWHNEDVALAEAVRQAALSLLQQPGRPIKLTRAAIVRDLKSAFVFKLDRLPLTRQTLQLVVESWQSFVIRRLEWAADTYAAQGVSPLKTHLLRLSRVEHYFGTPARRAFGQEVLSRVMPYTPGASSLRHQLLPSARQDWSTLDARLANRVAAAAQQLEGQPGYPTRITGVTLAVALDELEVILVYPEMLPQTVQALTLATETVEAFATRVVAWVMAHDPAVKRCEQVAHVLALTGLEPYATQPAVLKLLEAAHIKLQEQKRQAYPVQKPVTSTVDWTSRDQTLARAVSQAAHRLKSQSGPLVRASRQTIGHWIDAADLLEVSAHQLMSRYLGRLPQTTRVLAEVSESHEQFAIRRLEWVAAHYRQQGIRPTRSQLLLEGGAKERAGSPLIEQTVSRLLGSLAALPSAHELAEQHKWQTLDAEWSVLLKVTAETLKARSKPLAWVSQKALARQLRQDQCRDWRLNHMPRTAAVLAEVVETAEEFAIRRIHWHAADYRRRQVRPARYDFTLAAGVASMVKKRPAIDALVTEVLQTLASFPPEWWLRRTA